MYRDVILRALDERRALHITYAGSAPRLVQPHAIVRKADGTEILEAYQLSGFSDSGPEHGWRTFEVSRIDFAESQTEAFEPRRDFRPVSGESGIVIAQIRPDEAAEI